jgi:hypothetical protein
VMDSRTRGVLDTPPARGMTAVGGASSQRHCEEPLRRSNPALSLRPWIASLALAKTTLALNATIFSVRHPCHQAIPKSPLSSTSTPCQ